MKQLREGNDRTLMTLEWVVLSQGMCLKRSDSGLRLTVTDAYLLSNRID